jgi:ABC-type amino acid transport substrate-binding protein
VHTLADLTGLKVGVEIHGLPDLIAMTYRQGALAEQVVHVTQARALFAQLESGDIDAALVDPRELDAWRLSHSGTRVAPTGYRHSIGFNIGFVTLSTNGALIERVDAALAELLTHGNLIEIARANGMTYSAPRSPDVSPEVALDALSGD